MCDLTAEPIGQDEFARLMKPFINMAGFSKVGRVVVAVSGGADSLALAVLAGDWGRTHGIGVVALSVDHGLRPESRAEAEQVGQWLSTSGLSPKGIDHHILRWRDGALVSGAVQERARNARYGLLGAWCEEHCVSVLLTAHHQDDQAETFLMRLKRGSTLFGLGAMVPARPLTSSAKVMLCRPFLGVAKARLIATLRARGQDWIEDPSNVNRKFERVRVRAMMGPLAEMGVTAERLAGAAHGAQCVAKILDRGVDAFEATAVQYRAHGGVWIDAVAFSTLPQPLQVRAMAKFLCHVGGGVYAPRQVKMQRLVGWLALRTDTAPQGIPKARTLAGCVIERRNGAVYIKKEVPRQRKENGKVTRFFHQRPCPGRTNVLHPRQAPSSRALSSRSGSVFRTDG